MQGVKLFQSGVSNSSSITTKRIRRVCNFSRFDATKFDPFFVSVTNPLLITDAFSNSLLTDFRIPNQGRGGVGLRGSGQHPRGAFAVPTQGQAQNPLYNQGQQQPVQGQAQINPQNTQNVQNFPTPVARGGPGPRGGQMVGPRVGLALSGQNQIGQQGQGQSQPQNGQQNMQNQMGQQVGQQNVQQNMQNPMGQPRGGQMGPRGGMQPGLNQGMPQGIYDGNN